MRGRGACNGAFSRAYDFGETLMRFTKLYTVVSSKLYTVRFYETLERIQLFSEKEECR